MKPRNVPNLGLLVGGAGVVVIDPVERFAKDLFGVEHMESLVRTAEKHDVEYAEFREHAWASLSDSQRVRYRQMARTWSDVFSPSAVCG